MPQSYGLQSQGSMSSGSTQIPQLALQGGQSSGAMGGPQNPTQPLQYPITVPPYVLGGQSSGSMQPQQLQIQAPPSQFAIMDLIPEEQLPQEIKAEAEAAITSGIESYQYPTVKPNPKEVDNGEFEQQSKPEWNKEKVSVLRKQ